MQKKLAAHIYGMQAEYIVSQYLLRNSYFILHTRYKTAYGEIDLIAKSQKNDYNKILFCEVKARRRQTQFELISKRQKGRSIDSALFFLSQFPEYHEYEMRFDFFLVIQHQIRHHIKGAWDLSRQSE